MDEVVECAGLLIRDVFTGVISDFFLDFFLCGTLHGYKFFPVFSHVLVPIVLRSVSLEYPH